MASLKDDPLIREINYQINSEIDSISDWLAKGGAGSFDDYKKGCGKIAGLNIALNTIEKCIVDYMRDED